MNWRLQLTYIHTSICEIPTSESLQCNTGASAELRGGLEGWHAQGGRSRRERVCVHIWMVPFSLQQKLTHHQKTVMLQLKKKRKMRGLEFGKIIYDLALH